MPAPVRHPRVTAGKNLPGRSTPEKNGKRPGPVKTVFTVRMVWYIELSGNRNLPCSRQRNPWTPYCQGLLAISLRHACKKRNNLR